MNEQKERLERELRFLKESLEAGVITEEEYGRGKQRIEDKLREIFSELEGMEKEKREEIEIKELEAATKVAEERGMKEEITEEDEIKEEKPKIRVEKPEVKEELKKEKSEIKVEEHKEGEERKEEIKELEEEELREERGEVKEEEDFLVINKKVLFTIGIVALVIFAYFLMQIPGSGTGEEIPLDMKKEEPIIPLCGLDDDCKKEGKIGVCQNPNTAEATCLFKDPIDVNLSIINDKNCISCDTSRIIGILEQLFLTVNINEIDYNSAEAKKLISELKIDVLPAYVFDSKVNETVRFEKFKRALLRIGDRYLMLPTASGANYFFNRGEIKNRLDLFILSNDTQKLDNNIQEVLDLFGDNIDYVIHIVSEEEKRELKDELAVTTYPTFLINNKLKFSGIQPPETIKEKFCQLNNLEECSVTLSKDIKN